MPLNEDVVDSVANTNFKNIADAGGFYSGLAMQNAVNHQQSMQQIQLAATGQIVKRLNEVDVTEALSILTTTRGAETLPAEIIQLMSALNANQQGTKSAQTTPPPTAGQ